MFKVGITGGIGSGKSSVADFFKVRDILVIDLDQIARQVVEPGRNALKDIVTYFGSEVLTENGHLDRPTLAKLIFDDPTKKQWLEALLHPLIRKEQERIIRSSNSKYVIIEIPLLTENRLENTVDRVLLVDCKKETQLERAVKRGRQTEKQIHKIIELQASRLERQKLADDIVMNEGALKEVEKQLEGLHQNYLNFAKEQGLKSIL